MNNIIYSKIAANVNNKTDPRLRIRFNNSKILIEVLKLIKKSKDPFVTTPDTYFSFLNYCYYNWIPDYFFTKLASSSGKYHPAFANRSNGLMLHSLAVVRLADQLYQMTEPEDFICDFDDNSEYNDLICAAWLHDMFKYGDPDKNLDHCVFEHPKYAADFFKNPDVISKCKSFGLRDKDIKTISDLIDTHMGKYNTNKYSKTVLNLPKTNLQRLLFTADYLASRKENDIIADVL